MALLALTLSHSSVSDPSESRGISWFRSLCTAVSGDLQLIASISCLRQMEESQSSTKLVSSHKTYNHHVNGLHMTDTSIDPWNNDIKWSTFYGLLPLKWYNNITTTMATAQLKMLLLWRLRSLPTSPPALTQFCRATTESSLSSSITVWFSSASITKDLWVPTQAPP